MPGGNDRGNNPFEEFELDPSAGIATITTKLKALAEEATDDATRARIRIAWEELTRHPRGRLRAALFAHPETRPALGAAPSRARTRAVAPRPAAEARDLVVRPSVRRALAEDLGSRHAELAAATDDLSLDEDPALAALPEGRPSS